jgi:hypothetical protein
MNFLPANAASLAAFNGILVAVLAAILWAIHHAYRSPKAVLVAGGTLLGHLVLTRALWQKPSPPPSS